MGGKEYLESLRSYILKLTSQDIIEVSSINLSSAQKARVADWHEENNYDIPDLTNKSFWKFDNISSSEARAVKVNQNFGIIDTRIRVGLDVQLISEFLPDITEINKTSNKLSTIFTKKELSYCETKQDSRQSATGIFALKEAIFKASDNNFTSLKDIEIILQENSPPKQSKKVDQNEQKKVGQNDQKVSTETMKKGRPKRSKKVDQNDQKMWIKTIKNV